MLADTAAVLCRNISRVWGPYRALHVANALLTLAEAAVSRNFLLIPEVIHICAILQAEILQGLPIVVRHVVPTRQHQSGPQTEPLLTWSRRLQT